MPPSPSIPDEITALLSSLTPTAFENLTYDLVASMGLRNLVWRTPGSDGGRDIQGETFTSDFSGDSKTERWYIECKRYSTSIDWPTVWNKISFAQAAGVDALLVVTNTNPSPNCENEIERWNRSSKLPRIRFWRGYQIGSMVSRFPVIATKYGFDSTRYSISLAIMPVLRQMMKQSQSAYAALVFSGDARLSIEASAALAELTATRLEQVEQYGAFVPCDLCTRPPEFDWLISEGSAERWSEVGIRTVLCMLRYLACAKSLYITYEERLATLKLEGARMDLDALPASLLSDLSIWCGVGVRAKGSRVLLSMEEG